MWSFATHAGAGMAIAGLTATYYALTRRNEEGERERMAHESGFGDGPQVNRLRRHNENGQLSSSNMLLKKELEELSVLNGSGSGLNILYQQKNPLHRFYRSNFEITPIVSRVDTRPSSIYAPSEGEEIGTSQAGGESVFGSESNLDNNGNDVGSKKEIVSDESPNFPLENEKMPAATANVSEKGGGDVTDDKNEVCATDAKDDLISNTDNNENEEEDITSIEANQSGFIGDKLKYVQENQFLKRTPSPICFFKNPGFGNRYTLERKKKEHTPLVATLSASDANVKTSEVVEDQSQHQSENVKLSQSKSDTRQNSTQFLLSPDLSKSNVSVCEAVNPEKLLKRRKKTTRADAIIVTKTIVDTNPVEEMSEYNRTLRKKNMTNRMRKGENEMQPLIRLRADPEISNLCPPSKRTDVPALMQPPPQEPINDQGKDEGVIHRRHKEEKEKLARIDEEASYIKKAGKNNNKDDFEQQPIEVGSLIEEPPVSSGLDRGEAIVGTVSTGVATASTVNEIPSNSWISLPVRIYTNSVRTLPWSLIAFCILVVIVAGFLGIFLSRLANSVQRKYDQEGKL